MQCSIAKANIYVNTFSLHKQNGSSSLFHHQKNIKNAPAKTFEHTDRHMQWQRVVKTCNAFNIIVLFIQWLIYDVQQSGNIHTQKRNTRSAHHGSPKKKVQTE